MCSYQEEDGLQVEPESSHESNRSVQSRFRNQVKLLNVRRKSCCLKKHGCKKAQLFPKPMLPPTSRNKKTHRNCFW